MAYYRERSYCGAHLDPGEVCDCNQREQTVQERVNWLLGRVVSEKELEPALLAASKRLQDQVNQGLVVIGDSQLSAQFLAQLTANEVLRRQYLCAQSAE